MSRGCLHPTENANVLGIPKHKNCKLKNSDHKKIQYNGKLISCNRAVCDGRFAWKRELKAAWGK